MWVPRHIEQFIEAVIDRLGAIQDALREHNRSEDAANIRQQDTWASIGRQVSEMRPDDEYKRGANTYKHKSYWQQVALNILTALLAVFTLGAFTAAGIYACIAYRQLGQMRLATEAATRSTTVAIMALGENQLQFEATLGQMNAQTTIAQRAFEIQGRPWIGFKNIQVFAKVNKGDQRSGSTGYPVTYEVKYTLQNYGAAPALRQHNDVIQASSDDIGISRNVLIPQACNRVIEAFKRPEASGGAIFPNEAPIESRGPPWGRTLFESSPVMLLGCIAYQGTVGGDNPHATAIKVTFRFGSVDSKGNVPIEDLQIGTLTAN